MNPPTENLHQYFEQENNIQPVPPEPEESFSEPEVFRSGSQLVVRGGAVLPIHICIITGKRTAKEVSISLRNPMSPRTWYSQCPSFKVGLSAKQYENYLMAQALTWSFIGMGVLLIVTGALTLSIFVAIGGILMAAIAGIFRAAYPVTSVDATDDNAVIDGVGAAYLKQFPERSLEE